MIEFNQIEQNLFVGSFIQGPIDIRFLKQNVRITGVLNLQTDEDFRRLKLDYSKLLDEFLRYDLVIQRCPIIDFSDEDLTRRLPDTVKLVDGMLMLGHRVYLHCTAGRNRSATTVVAWLIKHRQLSLDEAMQKVTKAHRCDPVLPVLENWLANSG